MTWQIPEVVVLIIHAIVDSVPTSSYFLSSLLITPSTDSLHFFLHSSLKTGSLVYCFSIWTTRDRGKKSGENRCCLNLPINSSTTCALFYMSRSLTPTFYNTGSSAPYTAPQSNKQIHRTSVILTLLKPLGFPCWVIRLPSPTRVTGYCYCYCEVRSHPFRVALTSILSPPSWNNNRWKTSLLVHTLYALTTNHKRNLKRRGVYLFLSIWYVRCS